MTKQNHPLTWVVLFCLKFQFVSHPIAFIRSLVTFKKPVHPTLYPTKKFL